MSSEQICEQIFKNIDQDGSESIDVNEFTNFFSQFVGIVNVTGDASSVFKEIDTNGDGSLSKEELKAFITARLK